jgi:hypothetical protein
MAGNLVSCWINSCCCHASVSNTHFTSTSGIDRSVVLDIPLATLEVSVLLVLHFFILGGLVMLEDLSLCKFATVSSSELDTITFLRPLSYNLTPLLFFVDTNELTGPIPTELGSLMMLEDLTLNKFATVSSSELDTITLLGCILQFISSTVCVGFNQLTGNLNTMFCKTYAFSSLALYADCAGSPPEVVCICCDVCS